MKAVGQERRSAAHPPSHPSGQKIGGDGTWGEGRPPFAETGPISTSTAPDKRGSPVPVIAIGGASGEAPTATAASIPDKRGGSAPQAMLGGPGTERSVEGGGPAPDEPRDPCAKTPAIHAEGSQQAKEGANAETLRSSGVEVACHRGKVHSAAAGRSETRTVPSAAAPDGAFAVLTGEAAKSPPQGPAGGFADAPAKSAGYGTERIDVGSCAPQDPSMTVRMPPSHPAMGAASRRRPTPSVPAFGARAALAAPKDDDVGTKAPRGLGVSQVHLSGPMLYPGPRLPRTDSLAEAPPGSLADESAPAGHRQTAAPSGTAGAGQAKGAEAEGLVTPTAAAASARGAGGGGGLTPAQQYGSNLNKRTDLRTEIEKSRANQAKVERALELASKKGNRSKKETDEFYQLVGELNTVEPASMQKQLEAEKVRQGKLQQDDAKVAVENQEFDKQLSPTEKARAVKEARRQREQGQRLEKKRQNREERNSKRPDYRATQRAKARRAGNKLSKSLAKAKKLLKIAQNKNLNAKARKSALAKAKTQVQKAKQAALDKLNALDKAKATSETREALEELLEVEELEKEIDEAEEELEEEEQEPPPPDPCLLPCDCNIPCKSPDRCICSRQVRGGEPVPEEGGGGAAEPTPPDVLVSEGTTVAEEGNGDGEGGDGAGEKPSGSNMGADRGGPFGSPGAGTQFPDGGLCCAPQGNGGAPPPPPPDDKEKEREKREAEYRRNVKKARTEGLEGDLETWKKYKKDLDKALDANKKARTEKLSEDKRKALDDLITKQAEEASGASFYIATLESEIAFRRNYAREIERDEGREYSVYYVDGKPHIGVGFNLTRPDARKLLTSAKANYENVLAGKEKLDDRQIDVILKYHLQESLDIGAKLYKNYVDLPDEARNIIANMALNMGEPTLRNFDGFKKAIEKGDFKKAAAEMLDSAWARNKLTKGRAEKLAARMNVIK